MDDYLSKPVNEHTLVRILLAYRTTPSAQPSATRHEGLDLSPLRKQYEVLGNETLGEILDLFAAEHPQRTARIRDALLNHDHDRLRFEIHSLKGVCSNLYLEAPRLTLARIEEGLKSGELAPNTAALQALACLDEAAAALALLRRDLHQSRQ